MKSAKRSLMLILALALTLGITVPASAVSGDELESSVNCAAEYIYKAVSNPQVGSIGGEWAVLGLARSGCDIPDEYYQNYFASVEAYVEACNGVLHEKKYTEYSRMILVLTAIGKDPADVAGYNLLTALGDFDKTVWQGINGPIWALIALDSGNYQIPQNPDAETQATRQMYVDEILSRQMADGGWSLNGTVGSTKSADPDITGMALQALAKYTDDEDVSVAVEKALSCLSQMQDKSGGFESWGTANSESVVQVIVALCELGVDLNDRRFIKNENKLLDNLLSYQQMDGSFQHTASGGGSNQMASEQGFYGLVAALRAAESKNSLYRMSDAMDVGSGEGLTKGEGLSEKNADVKAVPISSPGITFDDIAFSESITAIEALASRGIINGMGNGIFEPEKTMTRAEFAVVIVRGLGLTPEYADTFADAPEGKWYSAYIDTANYYGIVNGIDSNMFNPNGTITRQAAATMVARAAGLCGMDTDIDAAATRDMLAQFGDYVTVESWARTSVAFCYQENILDQGDLNIEPTREILRCEIAEMLFNLLTSANLI